MSTATKQMARRIRKANSPPAEPPQSPPAMGWPEISNVPAQLLGCVDLTRHPLNRTPSAAAVAAVAESLARVGQLEPIVVRRLGSWILCDVTRRDGEHWLQSHDPTHVFGWISLTELCRTIGSRGVGITFHRAADVPGEFLSEWARRRIAGA